MKKSTKSTSKRLPNKKTNKSKFNNSLFLTLSVAMFGVIVGVLGALGFVGSYLHSQLAAENSSLSHQIDSLKTNLDIRPASYTAALGGSGQCSLPTSSTSSSAQSSVTPAPAVVTASAVAPTPSYYTSTNVTPTPAKAVTPFVQKLINGQFTTTAAISNTGPESHNAVTTTNTATMNVTNNNDLSVTSSNPQTTVSGNASETNNTTAGSATTGNSSNTSNTKLDISINN
jgi:cytoskeletal protein RodZ